MNTQEKQEYEPLEMKIKLRKDGTYILQGFSIKTLNTLEEWHNKQHQFRKWTLTKDEQRLYLY